jgi:hypothetical protein
VVGELLQFCIGEAREKLQRDDLAIFVDERAGLCPADDF